MTPFTTFVIGYTVGVITGIFLMFWMTAQVVT